MKNRGTHTNNTKMQILVNILGYILSHILRRMVVPKNKDKNGKFMKTSQHKPERYGSNRLVSTIKLSSLRE